MSPTILLVCGLVSFVIGVLGAVLNVATFASGRRTTLSVFIAHGFCAIFYVGGVLGIVVGLVMFLINYTKS